MIKNSKKYLVFKNNVGTQENIKFPEKYRNTLNEFFLKIINVEKDKEIFNLVHSNTALNIK